MYKNKLLNLLNDTGLKISDEQIKSLSLLLEKLLLWNKTYNLTAIKNPDEALVLHILDSLSVLPYIQSLNPKNVLDVGTGPGFPGMPLAIIKSDTKFTLLDKNIKKINFVQHMITLLRLDNASVEHIAVEKLEKNNIFDCIVSRALSDLGTFVKNVQHLLSHDGVIVAMKGKWPEETWDGKLPAGFFVKSVLNIKVPGLDAARNLVFIKKEMSVG